MNGRLRLIGLAVIAGLVVAGLLFCFSGIVSAPSLTTTTLPTFKAAPEPAAPKIKVLTLYQKGERFSNLAVGVSSALGKKFQDLAIFQSINLLEEPQLAGFYDISSAPAVVFVSPGGKVLYTHEGFLAKEEIIRKISELSKG